MVYTNTVEFEWDADKNRLNFLKHKISFEEALFVFWDPDCFIESDLKHSTHEHREYAIGLTQKGVLFIVYTIRKFPAVTRLISARKASQQERDEYEKRKTI